VHLETDKQLINIVRGEAEVQEKARLHIAADRYRQAK
jgi:hypothetical protein